jgi:hypothetical protein
VLRPTQPPTRTLTILVTHPNADMAHLLRTWSTSHVRVFPRKLSRLFPLFSLFGPKSGRRRLAHHQFKKKDHIHQKTTHSHPSIHTKVSARIAWVEAATRSGFSRDQGGEVGTRIGGAKVASVKNRERESRKHCVCVVETAGSCKGRRSIGDDDGQERHEHTRARRY